MTYGTGRPAVPIAALLLCACFSRAAAQSGVPIVTPEPEAVFPEPFSAIVGIRELHDGRVLIADRLERHVSVVDFGSATIERVGREGQGPGEYRTPSDLLPLPGDATLLVDMGNMRLTTISGTHQVGTSTPMMRSGDPMVLIRPQGADRDGNVYFSTWGLSTARSSGEPDSTGVIRWNPETDRMDTVAFLSPRAVAAGQSPIRLEGGGVVQVAGGMPAPFAPQDAWGVAPDGTVLVARAAEYRIDRYAPDGRVTIGPVAPHTPVKVTAALKDRWADQRGGIQMSFRTPEGGGRTIKMARPNTDDTEFPESLPPFGRNGLQVAPDGRAWVELSRAPGDPVRYEVFDADGRVTQRVEFSSGRSIVGHGSGFVYVVAVDEDDLQWLERYRVP